MYLSFFVHWRVFTNHPPQILKSELLREVRFYVGKSKFTN